MPNQRGVIRFDSIQIESDGVTTLRPSRAGFIFRVGVDDKSDANRGLESGSCFLYFKETWYGQFRISIILVVLAEVPNVQLFLPHQYFGGLTNFFFLIKEVVDLFHPPVLVWDLLIFGFPF